ncbi:MAG: preprotein translocase subunit YajC [Candidatus Marinimicrobia bacterium]|nr:preprotein translocase subunit YajC [Candidatus Neomarinimicrobiota bacterium]MDD9887509.1 preprotein translocase subunit YajC [Candidatus Neomarinimicrobiota bacterium]MDD9930493.1 preprotein translocase subunit YajC [Candidatus Neomarinimicrobiota bacterium]
MNLTLLFSGGQNAQGGGLMAYLPFILILAIMYFLMIRPQAKRQKEKQNMLGNLKKGDRVVTIGGLHGTISGFKGKEKKAILLKVDKNISLTVNRSAVAGLTDKMDASENEAIEDQS